MHQARPEATFLFINKDPMSDRLSRNDRHGTGAVQRHAQSWVASARRRQKIEALRLSSTGTRRLALLGFKARIADEADDEHWPKCDDYHNTGRSLLPGQRMKLFRANFLEGDSADPFNSTAVRISQQSHSILQYYMWYSRLLPHRPSTVLSTIMRGCMQNELHCYAVLATTAGRMRQLSVTNQHSADEYMQRAIRALRTYLRICVGRPITDQQVVLDVLFLALGEWYRQDHEAALVHLRGLRQLTPLLDQSSAFGRCIFEMVTEADVYIAVAKASRSLFDPLQGPDGSSESWARRIETVTSTLEMNMLQLWTSFPWNRARELTPCTCASATGFEQRMGQGFIDALDADFFGPEMYPIIADLVKWTVLATYIARLSPKGTEMNTRYLFTRNSFILLQRLLSVSISGNLYLSPTAGRQECCRLALVILMNYMTLPVGQPSAQINMRQLQRALLWEDISWGSKASDEMLLWVLCIGLLVAIGMPEEEWFLTRAAGAASKLDVYDERDLQTISQRYLHIDTLRIIYEPCWSRLTARLKAEALPFQYEPCDFWVTTADAEHSAK
jgi:hypothetical protein